MAAHAAPEPTPAAAPAGWFARLLAALRRLFGLGLSGPRLATRIVHIPPASLASSASPALENRPDVHAPNCTVFDRPVPRCGVGLGTDLPLEDDPADLPVPARRPVDIASRAIAHEMTRSLGQTVAVENRPGAGGNVGGGRGSTRGAGRLYDAHITTSGIQAINPVLYKKMPFDPNKELTPVAALVSLSNVLVLHPSVKANSVADVIAMAKKRTPWTELRVERQWHQHPHRPRCSSTSPA